MVHTNPIKPPSRGSDPAQQLKQAQERLEEAETLRLKRSFDKAEAVCNTLLRQHPDYYGALHTLGLVLADRGDHKRAIVKLVQASIEHPRSWQTLTALAASYIELDAEELAADTLERAINIKPDSPDVLIMLGEVYERLRDYPEMLKVYERALKLEPNRVEAAWGVVAAAIELGEYTQAAETINGLIKRKKYSLALLELATALPKSFQPENLPELLKLIEANPNPASKAAYLFIQSRILANAGDHEAAWQKLIEANKIKLARDPEKTLHTYTARINWLHNNAKSGTVKPQNPQSFTSLFILGPSRSGKTTAEKLISQHPEIFRGFENRALQKAIKQTFMDAGLLNWSQMANLPSNLRTTAAKTYNELVTATLTDQVSVFTNTMPNLVWDVPFIREVIGGKYIFIDRDLDDLALDIFSKNYKKGHAYSYSLTTTYKYIALYKEMVELIQARMPEDAMTISYEEIMIEPNKAFDRITKFLNLPPAEPKFNNIIDGRGKSRPYKHWLSSAKQDL